jgi:hypothetical protein
MEPELKINRKLSVSRKQVAHFLGERAQIQDSWVFSSSAFEIWDFGRIREKATCEALICLIRRQRNPCDT